MQYAWLIWSLLLVAIWLLIYFSFVSKDAKRKMLSVSLWTSLLGLSEPLFVPEYWSPPSLFDLALRTGFDIESLIFSFAIGGIAVVLYELISNASYMRMSAKSRHDKRHRYHLLVLLSAPIIFVALLLTTSLNPIYTATVALVLGGFATWYCRPDLKKKMFVGGLLFLGLYFF